MALLLLLLMPRNLQLRASVSLCRPSHSTLSAPIPPQLFTAAAEAAAAYQRWKSNGDSRPMHRSQSLKRKWANEGGSSAAAGNENAAANAAS